MLTLIWDKDGAIRGVLGQNHSNWGPWVIDYTCTS